MADEPPIYLDYNATTPVDPRVLEAMRPVFLEHFGNAASRQHRAGQEASRRVEAAREQVAAAIGADPREIVWTSGATEANNLALKGLARAAAYRGRRRIVTVVTEHKAVLDPCATLEEEGYAVARLPVDGRGALDLERLERAITDDTLVVSVMHANNEIGTLHPIAEIARLCRQRGVLFHTDATQSFGKEPIDVEASGIDLLSCSAHKLCGPKGVGALYVRRRRPRVRCEPQLDGGGHERGMRSGTLNVPGIVGFGAAAEIAVREREQERVRVSGLRDRLEGALLAQLDHVRVNGDLERRLSGTTNLAFGGVDAESLLRRMPRIAASSSAACTSAQLQPSYVLAALGLARERIDGSLRFSAGRFTTGAEIDAAVSILVEQVAVERAEGPTSACGPGL